MDEPTLERSMRSPDALTSPMFHGRPTTRRPSFLRIVKQRVVMGRIDESAEPVGVRRAA
jgi:hypothetical protein